MILLRAAPIILLWAPPLSLCDKFEAASCGSTPVSLLPSCALYVHKHTSIIPHHLWI